MTYPICELGFFVEDQRNKGYYLREIDQYASTASKDGLALSLRKRIKDDVFELVKWNEWNKNGYFIRFRTNPLNLSDYDVKPAEIIFESDDFFRVLQEAASLSDENISFAMLNEGLRQAGYSEDELVTREKRKPHIVCKHKRPDIDGFDCGARREEHIGKELLEYQRLAREKYGWKCKHLDQWIVHKEGRRYCLNCRDNLITIHIQESV